MTHACPAPVIPLSGYYGISKSLSNIIKNNIQRYNLSDSESHKQLITDTVNLYEPNLDSIIKSRDELVNDCHYRLESLQDIDPLVKEAIHYKEHGEFKFYTGQGVVGNGDSVTCMDNYKDNIQEIEDKITNYKKENPGATLEQANKDLFKNSEEGRASLVEADSNALCIAKDGGNPDDYTVLSDDAQDIINYDPEFLSDISPNLVEYATVSEFGSPLVRGLALASAIGIPIVLSKTHAMENIYKTGYRIKSSFMKLRDRLF